MNLKGAKNCARWTEAEPLDNIHRRGSCSKRKLLEQFNDLLRSMNFQGKQKLQSIKAYDVAYPQAALKNALGVRALGPRAYYKHGEKGERMLLTRFRNRLSGLVDRYTERILVKRIPKPLGVCSRSCISYRGKADRPFEREFGRLPCSYAMAGQTPKGKEKGNVTKRDCI